jgi:membrane protein YdbS with pleckstrin-like domain
VTTLAWVLTIAYGVGAFCALCAADWGNYPFGQGVALVLFWPLWFVRAVWRGALREWRSQ